MPRKTLKRSLWKSKQPLSFVNPPVDGATHLCCPEVHGARNPKSFLSEDRRLSSAGNSTWVTPQFDNMQLQLPARRGRRGLRKSHMSRTVLSNSSLLSFPHLKKTSVCKFPSLSFESRVTAPPRLPPARSGGKANPEGVLGENLASEPDQSGSSKNLRGVGNTKTPINIRCLRELSVEDPWISKVTPGTPVAHAGRQNQGLDCTITTPAGNNQPPTTDSGFTPPDIETPEMLQVNRTRGVTADSSLSKLRLLFPQTPLVTTLQAPVLVSDTPEERYGWSWRRRQLSFLQDHG